jgi:hypothetical protein
LQKQNKRRTIDKTTVMCACVRVMVRGWMAIKTVVSRHTGENPGTPLRLRDAHASLARTLIHARVCRIAIVIVGSRQPPAAAEGALALAQDTDATLSPCAGCPTARNMDGGGSDGRLAGAVATNLTLEPVIVVTRILNESNRSIDRNGKSNPSFSYHDLCVCVCVCECPHVCVVALCRSAPRCNALSASDCVVEATAARRC